MTVEELIEVLEQYEDNVAVKLGTSDYYQELEHENINEGTRITVNGSKVIVIFEIDNDRPAG